MSIANTIDETIKCYGGEARRFEIFDYIARKYPGINPASIGLELYHGCNHNLKTGFRYRRVRRGMYALNKQNI